MQNLFEQSKHIYTAYCFDLCFENRILGIIAQKKKCRQRKMCIFVKKLIV
jgi:hypothetical protein